MEHTHTHIGFTGTRNGMTPEQKTILQQTLITNRTNTFQWLHHGDCVGADAQAHELARHSGFLIHLHPPSGPQFRAYCKPDTSSLPYPYLTRNHHIVDATTLLIVTPARMKHYRTSGTWSTFLYARKQARNTSDHHIIVIWPDGTQHTY